MPSFIQMVDNYTAKETKKLERICQPIYQHFGVTDFWYGRTDEFGGYFTIANKPQLQEYYFTSQGHLGNPFFRNPELFRAGIYYYKDLINTDFQNVMKSCVSHLNIQLGITIVVKEGNLTHRFGYGGKSNSSFLTRIIDNLPLVQKFNQYFIKESEDLIKKGAYDPVDLPQLLGPSYHSLPKGICSVSTAFEKIDFLNDIGLLKKEDVMQLSRRELECLKYLVLGLPASKTAKQLHISTRTVETHLESTKRKLNCDSKAELIQKSRLLERSGFFS